MHDPLHEGMRHSAIDDRRSVAHAAERAPRIGGCHRSAASGLAERRRLAAGEPWPLILLSWAPAA